MSREIFGLVILLIQVGINIPVIAKLLKSKSGEGISLTGETIWIAGGIGWIIYGFSTNSTTLVISGSLAVVGCSLTSFLIHKYSHPSLKNPLGLGTITLVSIVGSFLLFGIAGLSFAMAVFGVLQFFPQLFETISKIRNKGSAGGVSVSGSLFRAVYTGLWAIYAGAWFLWGMTYAEIDYPLLAWGVAGVVVFGLQSSHAMMDRKTAIATV